MEDSSEEGCYCVQAQACPHWIATKMDSRLFAAKAHSHERTKTFGNWNKKTHNHDRNIPTTTPTLGVTYFFTVVTWTPGKSGQRTDGNRSRLVFKRRSNRLFLKRVAREQRNENEWSLKQGQDGNHKTNNKSLFASNTIISELSPYSSFSVPFSDFFLPFITNPQWNILTYRTRAAAGGPSARRQRSATRGKEASILHSPHTYHLPHPHPAGHREDNNTHLPPALSPPEPQGKRFTPLSLHHYRTTLYFFSFYPSPCMLRLFAIFFCFFV